MISHHSISLYYVLDFVFLYCGAPTIFNVVHLLMLCFVVSRQIMNKESIKQWIWITIFFFLLHFIKYALMILIIVHIYPF